MEQASSGEEKESRRAEGDDDADGTFVPQGDVKADIIKRRAHTSSTEDVWRVRLDREDLQSLGSLPSLCPGATHAYLQHNLIMDPSPLGRMSSLKFITLSNNRIKSLAGLDSLPNLLFLDVSDNLITSAMELIEPLPASIVFFNISGNPIVQQLENRLRRALIAALPRLRELDGYEVEPEEIEEAEREFGVNASDEENEGMQSQEKKEETGTSDLAGHLAGLSLSERSTQQEAPDRSAEGRKHQEGVERDKSMLQSLLPSLMEGTSVEADINGLIAESKRNIQRAREQAMLRGRQRAEEERHNQADNMERIKGLKDRGPHAIRSSAARAIEEMRGRSGTGDRNQDLG